MAQIYATELKTETVAHINVLFVCIFGQKQAMKKARKNITVPEENLRKFNEKADKIGIDANALINLLIAGVIGSSDYKKTIETISQVAPIGQQKNTP